MTYPTSLALSAEVAEALERERPVLALESSVISQGLPRPMNLEAARGCEALCREHRVMPATTAVIEGTLRVGLSDAQLERMGTEEGIEKAGVRDLARAVVSGATMATTVAATATLARIAEIPIMATGGIGGVHRGYSGHHDVSNDLQTLSQTPIVVVCAGFKSILDLPRTLETLETLGVGLFGYRTAELPDFYTTGTGVSVPCLDTPSAVADLFRRHRELGLDTAIVVANPPPADLAFSHPEMDVLVSQAMIEAERDQVSGKLVTPFLLSHIANATQGRSVELNVALLRSNVALACSIAVALSE